jgi:hypothetical protein
MRQDREHGFAPRTLHPPDGDSTQTNADIMRVACETPDPAAGGLVLELKAKGQEKSEDELDKRLAVFDHAEVGGFVSKIDGDGAVFSRRFGRCAHVSPLCHPVSSADETRWG